MYSYIWDEVTGGLLLTSVPLKFSKEPRPVYYQELDILGFDKYWRYEKIDAFPYMWAEANTFWYRGRKVAQTKGGSLYTAPELILLDDPEPKDQPLRLVDIPVMVDKNRELIEKLSQDTIKKIYNTYIAYKDKVDIFYVAFSGGKDSVVALDLVQQALPHNEFLVMFGDTQMENQDTYDLVKKISLSCDELGIKFAKSRSSMTPDRTWRLFGPPAVTNRWCCSVHKTAPQILLLRELTGMPNFSGMAFTGIRGDESTARSEYSDTSFEGKHQGQYSNHPILEWNSAELYSYIFQTELPLNNSYKTGNCRVGCLVCPMSSGRHEYMKHKSNPIMSKSLIDIIKTTSAKTTFSQDEMTQFIDVGNWKKRRTGRELNFSHDLHVVETRNNETRIHVEIVNARWKEWAKTLGELIEISVDRFSIGFKNRTYLINIEDSPKGKAYYFPNLGSDKIDMLFLSLFRSVVIKSLYCVACGVCSAECKHGFIDMRNGLKISDSCNHCYQCHDMYEHCLRYNSIRNKIGVEKQVIGLDRYFSFGFRLIWIESFFKHKGSEMFWTTDGDALVANKKKDAFLNFLKDANFVCYSRTAGNDKYSRYVPTEFAKKLMEYEPDSTIIWALVLCNLAYSPQLGWYIRNVPFDSLMTLDNIRNMLESVMESDAKGLGKRNIADAIKIYLTQTPLGQEVGLGESDYDVKINSNKSETVVMNSFTRRTWHSPEPRVILYSLFRFSEACGNYHAFTLSRLTSHDIDSEGVSPTQIFGLGREEMEKLLIGLSINYPDFINTAFNHGLDNITLNKEKTAQDVLTLF